MDMNAYVMEVLSRHQLEELRAGAERQSQLREIAPARPLRVTLGLALIRLGTWALGPSHRRLARSF
jgi:hypothetical protein